MSIKMYDFSNLPPVGMEKISRKTKTEKVGYEPDSKRVERMMKAGEHLQQSRHAVYNIPPDSNLGDEHLDKVLDGTYQKEQEEKAAKAAEKAAKEAADKAAKEAAEKAEFEEFRKNKKAT